MLRYVNSTRREAGLPGRWLIGLAGLLVVAAFLGACGGGGNGNEVFSGELFNAPRCFTVLPVSVGTNTVTMLALNGTGGKGATCDHADVNTGEISIHGQSQNWRHRGGAGPRANINVTIGSAGGSCTPGAPPSAGPMPEPEPVYAAFYWWATSTGSSRGWASATGSSASGDSGRDAVLCVGTTQP